MIKEYHMMIATATSRPNKHDKGGGTTAARCPFCGQSISGGARDRIEQGHMRETCGRQRRGAA
jgi:hypothetical protein